MKKLLFFSAVLLFGFTSCSDDIAVTGITLNTDTLHLTAGEIATLTATIMPRDAINQNVMWKSSNSDIVRVDANGRVTASAHTSGTVTITVTTADGDFTATCVVTVFTPVTGVALNDSTKLRSGEWRRLTATIAPFNATNQNITWTTSNSIVATVDNLGVVVAVSGGTTTITAITECGSHKATGIVLVDYISYSLDGVIIDGVRWATRNVDAPGTFAENPHNLGMFYQWNRRLGWTATDPMVNSNDGRTWNTSNPTGTAWYAENDPCPAGWRIPTPQELQSLVDSGSLWRARYGVRGELFGTAPNQIFLPAVSTRSGFDGMLHTGSVSRYWSNARGNGDNAWGMSVSSGGALVMPNLWAIMGQNVRCVAK